MSHLRFQSACKSRHQNYSMALGLIFVMVSASAPQFAKADELEDMLVRLAAASSGQNSTSGQNATGPITSIVGANGVYGAIVSGSGNGSNGIMALNQDAGPGGATQANVVVVALSMGPDAAALARLLAEQVYESQSASNTTSNLPNLSALAIVDSYKGGSGIAQINQSAGQGNIQRNATLIAAALGGGDALAISEADLSATGAINRTISGSGSQRGMTSISGSFTDFSGIVQVNQTIGTGNVVSNTVGITYVGGPAGG